MNTQNTNLPSDAESNPTRMDMAGQIDELYRTAGKTDGRPPWMDLFEWIAEQTHISPFNLMLANIQRPGARFIASRKEWWSLGRDVKPESIPIIILQPFGPVRLVYELADTTGNPIDDEKLNRMFTGTESVRNDIITYVAGRIPETDRIEIKLVKLGSALGGDVQPTGVEPKNDETSPCWVIRINSNRDEGAQFRILIHELAHVYLGHLGANGTKWPDRRPERLDVREFEAEATAYIVGRRFGINTMSAEYLAGYIEDDTMTHVSYSAIVRAAGRIEQHVR